MLGWISDFYELTQVSRPDPLMQTLGAKSLLKFFPPFRPLLKQFDDLIGLRLFPRFFFTTLPLEIIVEIMKILDWSTLLSIRQTCQLLNAASRTRMVWEGQLSQYLAQRKRPIRLEEPLESYSTEDLERWVLVRRSADMAWNRDDLRPVRERKIYCEGVGATHLVPGGRWLLVGGLGCGSVTAYDLDAPQFIGQPLIPPDEQDDQYVHRIVISVDSMQESANLAFTMALSSSIHMERSLLHVSTWRVTLVGHKQDARLVAERLHNFEAHKNCFIPDIVMQRNLFARSVSYGDLCYLEVFDLEGSTSDAHCKAIIYPGLDILKIRILPGGRLLALADDQIMIYEFVIVDGVDPVAPTVAPWITAPHWCQSLIELGPSGDLSQGVPHGPATHFILTAGDCVLSLVIPNSDDQVPQMTKVMGPTFDTDHDDDTTYALGIDKAFIQYPDSSVARLSFTWENEGSSTVTPVSCVRTISKDYPTPCSSVRLPQVDEETGRIVQGETNMIWVLDTASLEV